MSIANEITRLQTAKSDLKAAIEAKGVSVSSASTLDDYADYVGQISGGGGSGLDFSSIGYDSALSAAINAELNAPLLYSKTLYDASDPSTTSADSLYRDNSQLVYAPKIDTSNVTTMGTMFYNCTNLKYVPLYNTSGVTSMGDMFGKCSSLTTIPQFDTSKVTTMSAMFSGCSNLTSVPQFNTSKVNTMYNMFNGCSNLTSVPLFNTSGVTNMGYMFQSCSKLTTIPQLDTSKVTSMNYMFKGCSSLTTIPQLDTSSVTTMSQMFNGCKGLTSLPALDFSSVTLIGSFFSLLSSASNQITGLTDLGGFINLKCDWNDSFGLAMCPNLTVQSLNNVIAGLYDFTGHGETPTLSQGKLKLGSTNYNKLSAAEIQVGTDKGWTITA